MLHERGPGGSPAWEEWHERRWLYKRVLFDVSELGAIEREAYDLDEEDITGKRNPRTYTTEPRFGEVPRDIRENPRF